MQLSQGPIGSFKEEMILLLLLLFSCSFLYFPIFLLSNKRVRVSTDPVPRALVKHFLVADHLKTKQVCTRETGPDIGPSQSCFVSTLFVL